MRSIKATLTDSEIISNLASGREVDLSLKSLYRAHYSQLSGFIIANSGSQDDAADIFQEVMIAFMNLVREGKFRGEASIRTFLYALNRNLWLNELKKRGRAMAREMNYERMAEKEEQTISVVIENRESSHSLLQVLEQLGQDCRKVLVLYYYENKSMKEIFNELHYENEQVVRNKKYKCLKKMEELIRNNTGLYHQLKNMLYG